MSLRGVYAGHVTDSVLLMAVPPFERDPLQLAYVQVAGHIAARIEAGELAPGARLPPERELGCRVRGRVQHAAAGNRRAAGPGPGGHAARARELCPAGLGAGSPVRTSGLAWHGQKWTPLVRSGLHCGVSVVVPHQMCC